MTSVLGLLSGVQNASGFRPDIVSFGKDAWPSFSANSTVISRCGGMVTAARVAEICRVNTVSIADGQYAVSGGAFTPFQQADSIFTACTRGPRWAIRPYWLAPGMGAGPLYVENYEDQKTQSSFGVYQEARIVSRAVRASLPHLP